MNSTSNSPVMELNFEDIRSQYYSVLKKAFLDSSIDILREKFNSFNAAEHDLKAPLDQVFRDVMLELLKDGDVEKFQNYVTFCIDTCRLSMTTPTMPVVLLGDIFDALTLNKCEEMFTFVENGVHIWKEELFFNSCKNNLLRMCNDLLRRLSRTQSTVFCGRILLFLAKFFPFSERSGLNIVSEFNLENITEYGTDSSSSLKDSIAELENINEEKKYSFDFNLYCKFWALQDFFRNPNQCYNKVQWKTFSAHSTSVLSAFSSCKLEDIQRKRIKLDSPTTSEDNHYFAKFLTNQKLLELQLSDANFRRCILLQFLILFQYLNSIVKFKSENYELKVDQTEWIRKMTDMVYTLLDETPPNGTKFAQIVRHILQREEHWNTWKNDGCPEFKKPVTILDNPDEVVDKRRLLKARRPKKLLGDIIKEASVNNKYHMGSAELTKLWNLCPDNLEACKGKDRDFLPSLETYFAEAIEQLDPSAMVEDEFKRVNNGSFGWRGLRLLAKRSPQFFTHSNNPINKLPEYLEIMIKRIAKDKQDKGNTQEIQEMNMQNYSEMEVEMLKDDEQEGTEDSLPPDENYNKSGTLTVSITQSQLDMICSKLDEDWKRLASKLGYDASDISFFEKENATNSLRARHMLQLWFVDDTDASIESLCYILEGLELNEISDIIKTEFINST